MYIYIYIFLMQKLVKAILIPTYNHHIMKLRLLRSTMVDMVHIPTVGHIDIFVCQIRSFCECEVGWWFGTFFVFPYIGIVTSIDQLTNIFQRGRSTTNQFVFSVLISRILGFLFFVGWEPPWLLGYTLLDLSAEYAE